MSIPALKYQDLAEALQAMGCRLRDDSGRLIDVTAERLRAEAVEKKYIECLCNSLRVELFVPAVPLQHEILRRAIKLPIGDREIPITTAEDMILLKLAFHRAKDLQDVRGMLHLQQGRLDLDYLRLWSAKSHSEAVQEELDQLLKEYSSHQ